MKKRTLSIALVIAAAGIFLCAAPAGAKKLVSEAKSVIQDIQKQSTALSGELTEFHREFSARASKMVKMEAAMEELKEKGYLGKTYGDTPEKYERIYAEYARYMAEIKEVFSKYAPKIQTAVTTFNRSVYQGKDRIEELRSDDMAIVDAELKRIKTNFQELKKERLDLSKTCPEDNKSRNCYRLRADYQRQLRRIEKELVRLKYMKQMSEIKESITDKLSNIISRYVDKEADTVEMLMNYAFSFEQYADIIGSKDLGGMLKTVRELAQLETKIRDFEQFQKGLEVHVADVGNLVGDRLDNFMKQTGGKDVDVESRGDVLRTYDDHEARITDMIRQLGG